MRASFSLGRVWGVPLGATWSFLAVTVILAVGLASGVLPSDAPGNSPGAYAAAGVATATLFMIGVAAHEMGHALVARRQGLPVKGITLWLLGGVTQVEGEPRTPGAELALSGAGPLVSLVLGLVAGGAAYGAHLLGAPILAVVSLAWLGGINVVLAVLNVLPASPLDGGRLLHALVWRLSGNRIRATNVAATAGVVLGGLLGVVGALLLVRGSYDGLWILLTGWFLAGSAGVERRQAQLLKRLDGLVAADVMEPTPVTVPAWVTIQALADDRSVGPFQAWLPVEAWGGGLAGLVRVADLASVPVALRPSVRVGDLAVPADRLERVGPGEPLTALLPAVQASGSPAIVEAPSGVVGVITSGSLVSRAGARRRRPAPGAPTGAWAAGRRWPG